eukprot:3976113-Amphidinium_carterae.1
MALLGLVPSGLASTCDESVKLYWLPAGMRDTHCPCLAKLTNCAKTLGEGNCKTDSTSGIRQNWSQKY